MKLSSSNGASSSSSSGSPFTANQWQELEQQALIFKYMVSGVPIPSQLIFPLNNSNSLFPSKTFGWGCYNQAVKCIDSNRKLAGADPEAGRCKRTDGKKWRCSKEAYPNSKYCERHMHRGRNRTTRSSSSNPNHNILSSSSTTSSLLNQNISAISPTTSSYNGYPAAPIPSAQAEVYFHGDSLKYMDHERVFFPQTTNLMQPLMMNISNNNSYNMTSTINYFDPQANYGTSTSSDHNNNSSDQHEDETQKQLHHFFGDSWLDLSSNSNSNSTGT